MIEDIFLGIVCLCIFIIIASLSSLILWTVITNPYFKYKLYRKTNKIQWKCEEIFESRSNRLQNKEESNYECLLYYRILPSELNKFVRIFGDNSWINPFDKKFVFKNKEEFKEFVSNFTTYNDIKTWIDEKNCILWYEP